MSTYRFRENPPRIPETQPATAGGPPQPPPNPPKQIARDLLDPGEPAERIFLPDFIEIKALAEMLELKPFKVVADMLQLGIFKHADEVVDFATASKVAGKHGRIAEHLV